MTFDLVPFASLLSHVVDNRGRTCPTASSGTPLIATNCVKNDILYPVHESVRFVDDETHSTWFRGHPEPGDLLFVTKGSPGRVCLAPDPVGFCIAQDMVAIRADDRKIYPKYLFAVLRSHSVQNQIEQLHVGSLIPHFKKGDFDKLLLPVPNRESQVIIGDTYFDLSSKIDLNRRMNETLEAIARAIFKSWFVDFDPARAKAEGRQPVGMDAETAALFPNAFEETELGEVPAGWNVDAIGNVVRVVGGSTPSTKEPAFWNDGTLHWATPKDLAGLAFPVLLSTERQVTAAGLGQISSGLLPRGTVLLSSRAPIGYLAIAEIPVAVNQGFIAMICDGQLPNLYVLRWAEANMEAIKARANGTTFLEISKRNFRPLPMVVPPHEIIAAFIAGSEPLYRRIAANLMESTTLEKIRDALLPKLLLGEVSVQEAMHLVEVVGK